MWNFHNHSTKFSSVGTTLFWFAILAWVAFEKCMLADCGQRTGSGESSLGDGWGRQQSETRLLTCPGKIVQQSDIIRFAFFLPVEGPFDHFSRCESRMVLIQLRRYQRKMGLRGSEWLGNFFHLITYTRDPIRTPPCFLRLYIQLNLQNTRTTYFPWTWDCVNILVIMHVAPACSYDMCSSLYNQCRLML